MKILIAAGIYPPDIGGPAPYAKGVHDALLARGFEPPLILFRDVKKYPSGLRHLVYFFSLLRQARGAHAIFAFDTWSAGVPAACVSWICGVPLVIRVGGDFVWEDYMNRTRDLLPLPFFYAKHRPFSLKERVAFWLVRFALLRAELAFNTQWLAGIWMESYRLAASRVHVVANIVGERCTATGDDATVLMFNRETAFKNSPAFRAAFAKARQGGVTLQLEEGRVPRDELIARIRRSHAVAVPSVSEVAPNTIIDALRCGKPFLLSKYSGYAETFAEYGVIIDPLDEASMIEGIEKLADPATYSKLCAAIAKWSESRSYDDVTAEMLALAHL